MITIDEIIARRKKIEASKIEEAFTPTHPKYDNLFCGRLKEVMLIIDKIPVEGSHIVLYGDRGVGKTSLANYILREAENASLIGSPIIVNCNVNDTFELVMGRIFKHLGIEITQTQTQTNEGSFMIWKIGISGKKEKTTHYDNPLADPDLIAETLKNKNIIILIDEFDLLTNKDEKIKFSNLMKALSDKKSEAKIFIVGISLNIEELIEGHNSIDRSLLQVSLGRMTEAELSEIITKGEDRTQLKFDDEVKTQIVEKSLGFPYFTHLLALESSKIAVLAGRKEITIDDFKIALEKAISNCDASLKSKYDEAIGVNKNARKMRLLYAASLIGDKSRFGMAEWISKYKELFGDDIEQVTISSSMQNNITNDGSGIFKRIRQGSFIFSDSRMPCYINLQGKPE